MLSNIHSSLSQDGYYKKQYDVFEWEQVQTKNIDVYFTSGNKKIAEFAAQNSERALEYIKWKLKLPAIDKLELFIYGSHNEFVQTNLTPSLLSEGVGGFTELLHSRIAIPFSGDFIEFRNTIYHEIVHAYLNKYYEDEASFISFRQYMPLWLNEGIAEYYSKEGGMDMETDMFMRSFLFGSTVPKAHEIYGFPAYRFGEAFCNWVSEYYGKDKIEALIKEYATRSRVSSKYYNVFNLGDETIERQYQDEMKKIYNKESEKFKVPEAFADLVKRKRMKGEEIYTSNPSVSPDGAQTAYIGNDDGELGIYLYNTEMGKNSTRIVKGWNSMGFQELSMGGNTLTWHPTEKKIAFTAKTDGFDNIYIYNTLTEDYEQIVSNLRYIQSMSWSHDGSKMAISANNNGQQDIYVYSFTTKNTVQITDDIYYDVKPIWSSDSKSVYYISSRANKEANKSNDYFNEYNLFGVYRADIATKEKTTILSPKPEVIARIAKGKQDSVLYVLHDGNGIYNIYKYNILSAKSSPITNTRYAIKDISIDTDEKNLLFSAYNGTNIDLFMLNNINDIKLDTLPYTQFKLHKLNPTLYPLFIKDTTKSNSSAVNSTSSLGAKNIDSMNMRLLEKYPMVSEPNFSNVFRYDSKNIFLGYTDFAFAPTLNAGLTYSDLIRNNSISIDATVSNHHFSYDDFIPGFMYKADIEYKMKKHIIDYTFSLYTEGYSYPNNYSETGITANAEYVISRKQKVELNFLIANSANDSSAIFVTPSIAYTYNTLDYYRNFAMSGNYVRAFFRLSPAIGTNGANFGIFNLKARTNHPITKFISIGAAFDIGTAFGSSPPPFRVGGTQGWMGTQQGIVNGNIYTSLQDIAFHQRRPVRGFDINQIEGTNFSTGSLYCKFPFVSPLVLFFWPLYSVMRDAGYSQYTIFYDIGTAYQSFDQISVRSKFTSGTVMQSFGVSAEFSVLGYDLRVEFIKPILNGEALDTRVCLSYGIYF